MVETDVCYNRKQGSDDVCAVEPSAKPHFDDGDINFAVGEILERQSCSQFKKLGLKGSKKLRSFATKSTT